MQQKFSLLAFLHLCIPKIAGRHRRPIDSVELPKIVAKLGVIRPRI